MKKISCEEKLPNGQSGGEYLASNFWPSEEIARVVKPDIVESPFNGTLSHERV